MIPNNAGIVDAASFFQTAFTIVIALSIGEAFKQFVADRAEKPEDRTIHWARLPALISFLFLAFPFFHGMHRYFFEAYLSAHQVPRLYGVYLIFDSISFIAMSALFFAMSRHLSAVQWRKYFVLVLLLLSVDTSWIIFAVGTRGFPVAPWLVLNAALAAVLIALLLFIRSRSFYCGLLASALCASTVTVTTTVSYVVEWSVLFPS